MGRIHEIQDDLIESIRKRRVLEGDVATLESKIVSLESQRDKLLTQRPAPLVDGWEMPKAPLCPSCGAPIAPEAYIDIDEIYLRWSDRCGKCETELNFKTHDHDFDQWPFAVDIVWHQDLERVGFKVES